MTTKPKTLLVEFAPRGEVSKTKSVRKIFTDLIQNHTEIEALDIGKDTPDIYTNESLQAYYKRNYAGQNLTPEEAKLLQKMDSMRDQFMASDYVIISSPLYNFGFPATVKAWIDSVVQKGYAYEVNEQGHVPKLQNKNILIIYTSGLVFDQISENENWNGLISESARLFEYMGAKVRVVHLQGVDMLAQRNVDFRMENVVIKNFKKIAKSWFDINS
jgi:FMN-dependent NADH-azoreductase